MSSILLIHSDPSATRRITDALGADSTLAVSACAASLAQARQALAVRTPDLLLAELRLPDGPIADLLRELRPDRSHVLITAATLHDPQLMHTLRMGADCIIAAGAPPEALRAAVRATLAGESLVDAGVARQILALFGAPGTRPLPDPAGPALSAAECNLLEWASEGYDAAAIARAVKTTPAQVGLRLRAVLRRLHAAQRALGDGAPLDAAAFRTRAASSR